MSGPSSSASHSHAHQHQGGHFDEIAHAYDESIPAHVMEHGYRKRVAFRRRWAPPGGKVLATPRPGIRMAAAEGPVLPFRDDVFDLVYGVAVLHHVVTPTAVKATLGEMVPKCCRPRSSAWCRGSSRRFLGPGASAPTNVVVARRPLLR